MPIRSKAQWGYLAANEPGLLHKWQHEKPVTFKNLPKHVKKKKKGKK